MSNLFDDNSFPHALSCRTKRVYAGSAFHTYQLRLICCPHSCGVEFVFFPFNESGCTEVQRSKLRLVVTEYIL